MLLIVDKKDASTVQNSVALAADSTRQFVQKSAVVYHLPDSTDETIKTISSLGILYFIISSNARDCQHMMQEKMRFIYQPYDRDPSEYLVMAFDLLHEPFVPVIGFCLNPVAYSAGILPVVHHNGELFCMLGVDKRLKKYSDFGGSFDMTFRRHSGDDYKNTILRNRQIYDGLMDPTILHDYFTTHSDPKMIFQEQIEEKHDNIKQIQKRENPAKESMNAKTPKIDKQMNMTTQSSKTRQNACSNRYSVLIDDSDTSIDDEEEDESKFSENSSRENDSDTSDYKVKKYIPVSGLGYGDTNTKYTSFRELTEETSYKRRYIAQNGSCAIDVKTIFDLDTMFNKLYRQQSYIYLGGDTSYKYDMYVVFLEIDDLDSYTRDGFLRLYSNYITNKVRYMYVRSRYPCFEDMLKMEGNDEMMGIDVIPIAAITSSVGQVDYKDFKNWRKINNRARTLLDCLRPCFADALVRYKEEFIFLERSFQKVKSVLLQKSEK